MKQSEPLLPNADVFICESPDVYHSKRNDYLTSSQIKNVLGLPSDMVDTIPDEIRREKFLIGKAAHALILEGRAVFEKEFLNGRKYFLNENQIKMVEDLNAAVWANPQAKELLSTGFSESVVRAAHCGLSCQIRIDWFNPFRGMIDLKTTDNLNQFDWDLRAYRYYEQIAFYRSVLKSATGVTVPAFVIYVGKEEMECKVREISSEELDRKEIEVREIIEQMAVTRQSGQWEGAIDRNSL